MEKSVLNLIGRVLFEQSDRMQSEKEEGEKIIQARKKNKNKKKSAKKGHKAAEKAKRNSASDSLVLKFRSIYGNLCVYH